MATTILVVSADKFTRQICSEALPKSAGYQVDFVKDGPDGLFALGDHRHSVALVDYDMEEMNGLQFLKRVRCGRSSAQRDLSIGMFTSIADQSLLTAAVGLDLNTLFVPPLSQNTITQRTGRILLQKITLKSDDAYDQVATPLCPRQIQSRQDAERAPVKTLLPSGPSQQTRAGIAASAGQNGHRFGPRVLRGIAEVHIGWQITDDVIGSNGVRLIGAGTVLTRHLLTRLHEISKDGNDLMIWARGPLPNR